jgi:3-phosphoshikimate 1-carboxyvinyltransferase
MTTLQISPLTDPLRATVCVPGSKSLTNRALLAAALAEGITTLTNALFSDDSRYFVDALERLGFAVSRHAGETTLTVTGLGGRIPAATAQLFVGNAGTAARFLTAMLTLGQGRYELDGEPRMRERPISDLLDALTQLGAQVFSATGCPPVTVTAAGLPGGRATIAGNVSSQFLSGLLLVAPYARGPVELVVERGLNSKPYVDMTLALMADFGVTVEREGYERFGVRPKRYQAHSAYAIESDASAASYFFAAPAICGGTVRVQNISRRSTQGDMAFLNVLAAMGCAVVEGDSWIEVTGPPRGELRGVEVDLRDMPDVAQTLAALAPFAEGPTVISGIASARLKETDRVAAMCAELARLGVSVVERPDGLLIQPGAAIRPGVVQTYNDHRMAMAFALVGLRTPGIQIENPGCVSKTFPNYFEALGQLRRAGPAPEVSQVAPVIRRARPEDYESLCGLMRETNELHRQHHPQIFQQPAGSILERAAWFDLVKDENAGLWVAEAERGLLGFVMIVMKAAPNLPVMVPRRYAVVENLGVTASARRQGVGRRLMEQAHAWAAAQGAATVELNVFEFNQAAMALYRELGYDTLSRKMSRTPGGRP